MKPSLSSASLPPPPRRTLTAPDPPPEDFLDYIQESDSESERAPVDPQAGPSTPPHQSTSTRTPAAPKSSRTTTFDTVPETPKLSYDQRPKRNRKQTQHYFEHGFARLVAEPQSYKEAMASLDSDAWQHAMMEEHQAMMDAGV